MTKAIKRIIRSMLNRFGYDIGRVAPQGSTSGPAHALHQRMYTMRHTMEDVVRHVVGVGLLAGHGDRRRRRLRNRLPL